MTTPPNPSSFDQMMVAEVACPDLADKHGPQARSVREWFNLLDHAKDRVGVLRVLRCEKPEVMDFIREFDVEDLSMGHTVAEDGFQRILEELRATLVAVQNAVDGVETVHALRKASTLLSKNILRAARLSIFCHLKTQVLAPSDSRRDVLDLALYFQEVGANVEAALYPDGEQWYVNADDARVAEVMPIVISTCQKVGQMARYAFADLGHARTTCARKQVELIYRDLGDYMSLQPAPPFRRAVKAARSMVAQAATIMDLCSEEEMDVAASAVEAAVRSVTEFAESNHADLSIESYRAYRKELHDVLGQAVDMQVNVWRIIQNDGFMVMASKFC